AIVATNADTPDACLQVVAAADRTVRFVRTEDGADAALRRNEIIGVSLNGHAGALPGVPAPVVPVYYEAAEGGRGKRRVSVVSGEPLAAGTDLPAVHDAIRRVGETFEEQKRAGTLAENSLAGGH